MFSFNWIHLFGGECKEPGSERNTHIIMIINYHTNEDFPVVYIWDKYHSLYLWLNKFTVCTYSKGGGQLQLSAS
jgi:hypothetical protein